MAGGIRELFLINESTELVNTRIKFLASWNLASKLEIRLSVWINTSTWNLRCAFNALVIPVFKGCQILAV
jgi:hypothetical protein